MTVIGITMVRDEADIIGYTLPRMASQLDHVIVADNLSADDTRELLSGVALAGNVTVIGDGEPAYLQSEKMSALARMAGRFGGTWVVPFDADEVWTHPELPLRELLPQMSGHVVRATIYDHIATGEDPEIGDVVKRMGWRRAEPLPLPKVCCRVLPGLVIEQGNHGAHYPGPAVVQDAGITVHHYPYRSVEQMARKAKNGAAAYAAAGDRLPAGAGAHWREYGRFLETDGIDAIRDIFQTWFYEADPEAAGLVYDPLP